MKQVSRCKHNSIGISSFPGVDGVWFSLRNTTYHNNSIVMLEDIGDGEDDALLCNTNYSACCQSSNMVHVLGNWYFPNGTRIPSDGEKWDFYRTRGQMVVRMNRRRGGVEGIYRCVIPDAMNVTQTIYIGVYSASTGECALNFISKRKGTRPMISAPPNRVSNTKKKGGTRKQ